MKPNYFKSTGELRNYVLDYSNDYFRIEQSLRRCACNVLRESYEIIDRLDDDVIEIPVHCPHCANQLHATNQTELLTVNHFAI